MTIHVFSQLSQARKTGIIAWSSLIVLIAWGVVTVAKAEETEGLPIAKLDRTEPVDFSKEILPILRRNCLACHNSTDAESDLVLETPETIIKGGGEGPGVVADGAVDPAGDGLTGCRPGGGPGVGMGPVRGGRARSPGEARASVVLRRSPAGSRGG